MNHPLILYSVGNFAYGSDAISITEVFEFSYFFDSGINNYSIGFVHPISGSGLHFIANFVSYSSFSKNVPAPILKTALVI